jgi:uncharacterized membrane protein
MTGAVTSRAGGRTAASPLPDGPGRERIRSIDLLRGIAVICMVAAHAANALLDESFRHGWLWERINILFGFVAPAFLFLSGITLFLSLQRSTGNGNIDLRRSALTALGLIACGYWLQIPVLSFRQLVYCQRPEELARLFDVNILQAIGLSALLPIGLVAVTRSMRASANRAMLAAVAIAGCTPLFWRGTLHAALPGPVGALLAPQPASTFPLAPYACYLLIGFGAAQWIVSREKRLRGGFELLCTGALLIAASLLLPLVPPHDDFWGSSLHHVLFRLGGVVAALGGTVMIARLLRRGLDPIAWIGRRSLGIYVLHLMMIYGSPVNAGLRAAAGQTLAPAAIGVVATAALLASSSLLHVRERLAARFPSIETWGWRLWWGIFWIIFLARP